MIRFLVIACVIFTCTGIVTAQPELDLEPNKIEFEDLFNKLENVLFINKGNEVLIIDTIYYNSDLYYVRFDKQRTYPLVIEPGDTLVMDCILAGFLSVTAVDTVDTMFVASNSKDGTEDIRVKIDFYDDGDNASVSGSISDGENSLADANVYFFYEGIYLLKTVKTDANGFYSAELPEGRYTVAAEKDSFYMIFYDQQRNPFNAKIAAIYKNENRTIDFVLSRIDYTGNIISGSVYDSTNTGYLRKAIVVIRKGNHNPKKPGVNYLNSEDAYSTFVNYDGTFKVHVAEPDYYFVQSFSDYYLPAYYKSEYSSTVFWQLADSIFINDNIIDKNIYLPRDSSFGGGIIEGKIIIDGIDPDSLNGTLVFAQSALNNYIYSFGFSRENGEFKINNLPYGNYKLFIQKIGFENYYSETVEISRLQPTIQNVEIHVTLSGADDKTFMPDHAMLYPNYPNPFNPSTAIEFFIPASSEVELIVSNILGEEISNLFHGFLSAGFYSYNFNGEQLSSGTYIITLKTKSDFISRKILLLK